MSVRVRLARGLCIAAFSLLGCMGDKLESPVHDLAKSPDSADPMDDEDDAESDDDDAAGSAQDADHTGDSDGTDCPIGAEFCACDRGRCDPGLICAQDECITCEEEWCAICDNGVCDVAEDCESCSRDCGSCEECGDGTCERQETCVACPKDCGDCDTCGNGICDIGENCSVCAEDCGGCRPEPACGDGTCDPDETCLSCSADCGSGCDTKGGARVCDGVSGEVSCYDPLVSRPGVTVCTCDADGEWVACGNCDTY